MGLEIQRNNRFAREEENRLKGSVDLALSSLSASEKEAVITVLKEFRGDEGDIVTSKIAEKIPYDKFSGGKRFCASLKAPGSSGPDLWV